MSVNSMIAEQMKSEIIALEADIHKWEGKVNAAKESLLDLRKAYKALIGEDYPSDQLGQ